VPAPVVSHDASERKETIMSNRTEFPPAGQPKDDPKETLGKTMQELTDEAEKHLSQKDKKSGESVKHAPPGRSDIVP
jgi:hypothetical protein